MIYELYLHDIGSGVIYYEYEKREKFEDYDLKADVEIGTFKIRRYHFDDESFIHPLYSVRSDPDRPYEVPIEALMADQPLSSSDKGRTSARGSHHSRRSLRRRVASKELSPPKSWELIPPFEGWMCEGNKEEKEIGGMEPSVEKEEASEKEEEEEDLEEDPEEEGEEDPRGRSSCLYLFADGH
ncbi:hypothetical protein PIB30_068179 [Stylosanthes scabra]|uniref:Uncharacterized protein n=1 Tax=Stylosanthes scabra TaxID=79078 RepID=A0ABU6QMT7_9FABA|nr:hypothetical protein [Stylosanthes scabra]